MSGRHTLVLWGSAGLLAGALVLAPAAPSAMAAMSAARFHVALTKAEPGMNDTLTTSPTEIKLWFSEPVQAAVTGARLTGPGDRVVPVGAVRIAAAPKSPAVAAITGKLASGKYTVAWKTMDAEDGHPASGTFTFVVRLPAPKP